MKPTTNTYTQIGLCRETYQRYADSLFEGKTAKQIGTLRKYYAGLIASLGSFVETAASTDERPYVPITKSNGRTGYSKSALAERYFKRIPEFILIISMLSTRYRYSEHVEIFREACELLGLDDPSTIRKDNWHPVTFSHPSGMDAAACFNALCAIIRKDWSEKGYKARFQSRVHETGNRTKDYRRYIDKWFAKLATLIVLRIDLSYQPKHWETITLDELNADFDHLYNNARKNKLFRGWRGYIAKIEYGLGKGFHMHLILLFDTEHKQAIRHAYLTKLIGEYWKKVITKGRGAYWNCNADTKKYDAWRKLGIGPIHVSEQEKIGNLKDFVVDYLCKMDQFIRPCGFKGSQLIRRGNEPKPEPKKLGAPRKDRPKPPATEKRTDIAELECVVEALGF